MAEDKKFGEKLKKWADDGGVDNAIGGIATGVGAVAKISSNLKGAKALDERGSRMGRVDTLGNTMSGMSAGAELGSAAGPLGTLIGAGVGLTAGLGASLLSGGVDPQDQIDKEKKFQLGLGTGMIQNEGTFAQSTYTAENGMDVKGKPKQIEVERGELVLRKKGKAFHIDSSFEAMYRKSHKEGGEKYNARPGDIIVPKNKVASTKRNLKNRNWSAVESMRLALPNDEGQLKFADGVSGVRDMTREDPDKGSPVTYYKTKDKFSKRKKTEEIIYHRTANDSTKYGVVGTLGPTIDKEKKHANVYIDKRGNITWVNDPDSVAYHDKGNNERSFGIEIGGNMIDGKYEELTPEQTAALEKVTNFAFKKYGLNETNIKSHSESDGGKGARFNEGNDAVTTMQNLYKERPFTDDSEVAQFDGSSVKYSSKKGLTGQVGTGKSITVKASELNVGVTPGEGVMAPKNKKPEESFYNKDMTDPNNAQESFENEQDMSGATGFKNIEEAIAEEDARGYFSIATPTGYRAYLKNKFIVKGFTGSEADKKMQLLFGELESVGDDDMEAYTNTELGMTNNPIHLIGKKFADKILDSELLTDMNNYWKAGVNSKTGYKVFDIKYDDTKDDVKSAKSGDVSGFTNSPAGKSLAKDALKLKEFMYSSDNEDASWLKRRGSQFLNAWDGLRKKYLYDESYEGMTAEEIFSVVNDFSPKELTNFIKESGVGKEAAGFVYDAVGNPEQFGTVGAAGVRKLDMMALAVNAPGFIKGVGKGSVAAFAKYKTWKEASKAVEVKDLSPSKMEKAKFLFQALKDKNVTVTGKLTAKGLKSVTKSKKWGVQYEAMKNAPKSKSASKFKESAKGILDGAQRKIKNMDAPDANGAYKDADSLEEIMKLTDQLKKDGVITDAWDPKYKDLVKFFSDTYKTAMKLPLKARSKIIKKFTTLSPKEANESILRLEKLTGSSIDDIKNMSPDKLKKLMDDQTVKAFDDLKVSQGKTNEAWASHKKLAAREKELQKTINDTPVGNEKIAGLQEELLKVKNGIVENEDLIETIAKQKQGHWDRVSDVEDFVSTTPSHWKNAVAGEKEIAKNLKGIEGLEGEVKTILDAQKAFSKKADEIITSGSKEVDNVKNSILQVAKENKDAGLKAARSSQGSTMAAKNAAVRRSEYAEEVPGLMKGLKLHDDLMTMYKNGSKGLVQIYNELRKRGEPIISDEEVEFIQGEDEEFVVPEMVDEEEITEPEGDLPVPEKSEDPSDGKVDAPGQDLNSKKGKPVLDAVNDGLSTLGSYAGAAYNIARGLEEPDKVNRNYVNPTLEKYQDNSEVQRNVIDEAFSVSMDNSRNLSGGLASNFRSNIEKSWADKVSRNSEVNAKESQIATGVAGRNVQRVNQATQYNASVDNKADQTDMQSEAATKGFLGQGLSDVANIGAVRTRDKNQRIQDEKSKKLIYGNNKTEKKSSVNFSSVFNDEPEEDFNIFGRGKTKSNRFKI